MAACRERAPQVVLVLRWLRHRPDMHGMAIDAHVSDATAYRYLHEGPPVSAESTA